MTRHTLTISFNSALGKALNVSSARSLINIMKNTPETEIIFCKLEEYPTDGSIARLLTVDTLRLGNTSEGRSDVNGDKIKERKVTNGTKTRD